jgi:hypothetical protein
MKWIVTIFAIIFLAIAECCYFAYIYFQQDSLYWYIKTYVEANLIYGAIALVAGLFYLYCGVMFFTEATYKLWVELILTSFFASIVLGILYLVMKPLTTIILVAIASYY